MDRASETTKKIVEQRGRDDRLAQMGVVRTQYDQELAARVAPLKDMTTGRLITEACHAAFARDWDMLAAIAVTGQYRRTGWEDTPTCRD